MKNELGNIGINRFWPRLRRELNLEESPLKALGVNWTIKTEC